MRPVRTTSSTPTACWLATVRSSRSCNCSQAAHGILVATNLRAQSGRFYSRQVRVSGLGPPQLRRINEHRDRRVPPASGAIDFRAQKDVKSE